MQLECCRFKRQHSTNKYSWRLHMRISEIVDSATQQVNMLKLQAKTAQKRAKEAALRLKMQKAQQSLAKVAAKPL
jgi:hypothetical protein